ncbi:MAG TPA: peptidase, partial [Thauera aminoaromatica]|nr:peptidase [Thauera aminoaromatica]
MRKLLTVTAVALALGTLFPQASALSAAHAQAAAPSMVSPNRFGLPDFGDLVEQVGPAVVNIRVVQRAAQGTAGENPLAN